jgi:hypothetical protein
MKFIMKIIQKISTKEVPTPLGRWKLDYCNTQLSNKIELSNEDHCGSCGQYAITKTDLNQKNISTDGKNDANIKV